MNKELFKKILKPQIASLSAKNPSEAAEMVAKAYDKSLKSKAFTQTGQKFLNSDVSGLESVFKFGFELNNLSRELSSSVEPGWKTMAVGISKYWLTATFNLLPPTPPAASTTNILVTFPGDIQKLHEKLKFAFNQGDTEKFVETLANVLINYQSKIAGQYIGVLANGAPIVQPWVGVFGDVQYENKEKIIIDSDMSFDEAVSGLNFPKQIKDSLVLLDIDYISSDSKLHRGQIVVNKSVEKEIKEFFAILLEDKFPIEKMIPIVKYGWDDEKSMEANNTSGFNYRFIANTTRPSNHSFGKAIDINPAWNPVVYADGKILPKKSIRDKNRPGTLTSETRGLKYLKSKGWNWGGEYRSFKDWQHFDKE